MTLKFSIIIPLYNKEPYIERAIQSVLRQSVQDFEIIVVDDGSTDRGREIIQKIVDDRLRLVIQQNSGVSVARNNGVSIASFPFLVFLDADDTWEPTFLQEIVNLINEYPDAGIYGSSNNFIYPSGRLYTENFSKLFNGKKTGIIDDYFRLFARIQKSPFSNSNLCIPKKIYDEFGGYKSGVKLTEDSDLWCRIALKHPIAFNISPLANYYLAVEGSTQGVFEPKEYQVAITLREALKQNEVPSHLAASVERMILFQKIALIKRALMAGNKKFAVKKLFGWEMFYYFPKEFMECAASIVIPRKLFNWIRRIKN